MSTTKSLIGGVISGYNATIFAYGPTGTVVPVAVLLQVNKIHLHKPEMNYNANYLLTVEDETEALKYHSHQEAWIFPSC